MWGGTSGWEFKRSGRGETHLRGPEDRMLVGEGVGEKMAAGVMWRQRCTTPGFVPFNHRLHVLVVLCSAWNR